MSGGPVHISEHKFKGGNPFRREELWIRFEYKTEIQTIHEIDFVNEKESIQKVLILKISAILANTRILLMMVLEFPLRVTIRQNSSKTQIKSTGANVTIYQQPQPQHRRKRRELLIII